MKAIQLAVLGLAALIAAFIIGLTNPTLVPSGYESDAVTCGSAWSGSGAENAAESGEANCAQIRSERLSWSVTLALLGGGLVVCAIIGNAGSRKPEGPIVNPAPEFGRNAPPPPHPNADPTGPSQPPSPAQ